MNSNGTEQNAEIMLNAGAAMVAPKFPPFGVDEYDGRTPFVVVPDGYDVRSVAEYMAQPSRKRGTVNILEAASLVEYVKKHGDPDTTVIYADVHYQTSRYKLTAILNDHGTASNQAQWRDHVATLEPVRSLEWDRWSAQNGKSMSQEVFAAFIEDNMGDIASVDKMPSGKDMLEMALSFQATSEKRFKKRIDLQGGGTQLEYVDQADEATSTKMRFFERFTIGIPVFQGATDGYHMDARLKFRANGGALSFWYELVRPDRVFKTAVQTEISKIKEGAGFPVLFARMA